MYITGKDKVEADKISKHLLKKRLIACANMLPISSAYWWKGEIVSEDEYLMICKTLKEKYSLIIEEVKKIHSYDVPCISLIETDANPEYMEWVKNEVE